MTLSLDFQGQIFKWPYLRNKGGQHGMKGMWVDTVLDPPCHHELWLTYDLGLWFSWLNLLNILISGMAKFIIPSAFEKSKSLVAITDHPRRVVGSPIPILGDPSLQMWRFRQNLNWVILQIVSPGTTPPSPKKRDNLFVFINSTT